MKYAVTRLARPAPTWWKRFGVAGLLFFFAKGLLWLMVPALLVMFRGCGV